VVGLGRHSPLRTPGILQLEAAECGAACLGILLAHHGRWVSLEELRLACGVNRNGSKASNLLKAARGFGLAAKGFGKSAEQLMDLPRPSIIQWNFNQFVVFEGLAGGRAWLNDPAIGRRSCTLQELSDRYNGVVLAMEPGPGFRPGGPRPQVFAPLLGLLAGSLDAVLLIALFSLLLVLPGVLLPALAGLFVDKVLADQLDAWLRPICLAVFVVGGFQAAVLWLQQHYLLRLEARLSAVLSARVMGRLLALPMAFIGQRAPAELAGRVASADAVATALSDQVAGTAFSLIPVLAYAVAMAMHDWVVACAALLMPLLNLAVLRSVGRRLRRLNQAVGQDLSRLANVTAGTIIGIESVKVAGAEASAFALLAGSQARAARAERPIAAANAVAGVAPVLLNGIGVMLVLVVGGWRIIAGDLTIGALVAMQMLLANFNAPFLRLVAVQDRLQQIGRDLARVASLLAQPAPMPAAPPLPGDGGGRLELRAVSFGYSRTDPPLIDGLSLRLEPGQRIAVVGGSGSGKTTLGRLIAGLLEPWSGELLFDGQRLAAMSPAEHAGTLAYVDQEVFLFAGTVRDNLTLWDSTIPDGPLVAALQDAGLDADIAARPGGLDAVVAEAGSNFSGGQRQRLEIARALAGNPAVLVLDEATAALDTISELGIDEALRRRGCSCVIIAHRLSTIRDADEILVLDQGRVVERGSHAALLGAAGRYAALIGAEA